MNYFLDPHLLLTDRTLQIFINRLVHTLQNLTTLDYVKLRNDKIHACDITKLIKPLLLCLDKLL